MDSPDVSSIYRAGILVSLEKISSQELGEVFPTGVRGSCSWPPIADP
jgi:hypothetical protein